VGGRMPNDRTPVPLAHPVIRKANAATALRTPSATEDRPALPLDRAPDGFGQETLRREVRADREAERLGAGQIPNRGDDVTEPLLRGHDDEDAHGRRRDSGPVRA